MNNWTREVCDKEVNCSASCVLDHCVVGVKCNCSTFKPQRFTSISQFKAGGVDPYSTVSQDPRILPPETSSGSEVLLDLSSPPKPLHKREEKV